jgi:hypothetical protein
MKKASSIEVQGVQVFLRAHPQFVEGSIALPMPFAAFQKPSIRVSVKDAERIAAEILDIAATARQLPDPLT